MTIYTKLEQGQLSFLTKNKVFPPLVSNLEPNSDSCRLSEVSEEHDSMRERTTTDDKLLTSNKEVRHMSVMVRVLYYESCEIIREHYPIMDCIRLSRDFIQ